MRGISEEKILKILRDLIKNGIFIGIMNFYQNNRFLDNFNFFNYKGPFSFFFSWLNHFKRELQPIYNYFGYSGWGNQNVLKFLFSYELLGKILPILLELFKIRLCQKIQPNVKKNLSGEEDTKQTRTVHQKLFRFNIIFYLDQFLLRECQKLQKMPSIRVFQWRMKMKLRKCPYRKSVGRFYIFPCA